MRVSMAIGIVAMTLTLGVSAPAFAQAVPPIAKTVNLSGPRMGVTFLSPGIVDKLHEKQIDVNWAISQFGWQFEKQFFSTHGGLTAVTQWVGLVGGLEESVAIPSLTWVVGLRTRSGAEFGLGPNITPAGSALAVAGGFTLRAGVVNVPFNLAYVPSKAGPRITFLTGFSLRGRR